MTRLSSDTSLCENQSCPSRGGCLRYLSVPHDRQVYSDFTVPPGESRCNNYIPLYPDPKEHK